MEQFAKELLKLAHLNKRIPNLQGVLKLEAERVLRQTRTRLMSSPDFWQNYYSFFQLQTTPQS